MPDPPTSETAGPLRCYRHPGRDTLVSCSSCERPICPSCMVRSAVGFKCPSCAGVATGASRLKPGRRRFEVPRGTMYATIALIAINVLVFLVQMAQGTHLVSGLGGSEIVQRGALIGSAVADGDWWRLITAGFIHAGLLHIGFNMYALWWLGGALERYAGPFRMVAIYFTSILWGSAAAVLTTPSTVTVGASGGVFGLMAALLVLERQKGIALLGGSVGGLLVLNLIITFAFPGISIGGHIGGILGGAAAALVLSGFGRGHLAYGRLNPPVLIGLAVLVAGALVAGILIAQARTPMV